ncbi:molybdenum cofactor biosynthesis F family protein [Rothia sp. AR01]|uniref:Molybdenum cofactor biosynthesis F family protein n=1 Tax=Rothia santali TaxID=2949643 RepID=A0A9X2HAI7_9MICC|nr:MoaF C-terminal domain-containing protein [Rothia santali]MCP3426059.1 molybdenum cofactor biosynthesis F family protein [Rothia santali]
MNDAAFISVGALGEGFAPDANILTPVQTLDGTRHRLVFEDGPAIELAVGSGAASWDGAEEVAVRVTSVREGVALVDGVTAEDVSTSFVLDLEQGLVTVVEGRLPAEEERRESAWTRVQQGREPTAVTTRVRHGRIEGAGDAGAPLHAPTDRLVGLRNRYTYSPNESYEHIYLTPGLYTWHCIGGVEAGLADTDAYAAVALREDLMLFVWREKIVPTLGLLLIDLREMRTDGKIFGNEGFDAARTVNFPAGARAEILNRTEA